MLYPIKTDVASTCVCCVPMA